MSSGGETRAINNVCHMISARENNDLDIGENKDFTFSPGVTLLLGTCRINR